QRFDTIAKKRIFTAQTKNHGGLGAVSIVQTRGFPIPQLSNQSQRHDALADIEAGKRKDEDD
ncbi:MAG TPA: hypothetical protein QF564_31930, partial [Pirellulaceae bacterium]|nr:hypothetical protein [Pirellulaceae bacterium]